LIGQGERDEVQLLRDMLRSTVRVPEPNATGNGTVQVARTVAHILANEGRPNGRAALGSQNSTAVATVAAMGVRRHRANEAGR